MSKPATPAGAGAASGGFAAHPFEGDDGDKFREECGVFGIFDVVDAASFVALGLHALQHRGQEAAGVGAFDEEDRRFSVERRFGHVRDSFTSEKIVARLPGRRAIGHTRYSTAGEKGQTELRDIQPLYAELSEGGVALAHNGNFTNAELLRAELVASGSIFQSGSDTECVLHLMSRSIQRTAPERLKDALRRIEGAFSIVALTAEQMIGVRDPRGVRPLVLGKLGESWILASETVALDIVNATFEREVEPGEMVVIDQNGLRSEWPFAPQPSRFCVFEYVYFSRSDSEILGRSVYEARQRIGEELAREAPVEADLVCPVPDSGTPAAIGFSEASGIPFAQGIVKNQYVGRTFIEPTEKVRNMGVRLKLNVNRRLVAGKRVVLVDDSVVRGTTSRKIREMVQDAGAREVHFRIASPPTAWPCFYGVDTPDRGALMAARWSAEEMREELGVDSLRFVSLDGLYRACGVPGGRDPKAPQFCDACFSGLYPIEPVDGVRAGRVPPPRERAKRELA
ncbi:MAG: amidophosphoribosyltransferase [Pseudomonadota bacterium]